MEIQKLFLKPSKQGEDMTEDEIFEIAIMKCGFVSHEKPTAEESEIFLCNPKDIIDFAKLVAEHEREACAKIVDENIGFENYLSEIIRAKGQA
jgi:hypothetical protein